MEKKIKTNLGTDNKPQSETLEDNNVDKIREILFGNQMHEFEHKFNKLEERISGDISNIRKENSLQIESLQTFIKSEIKILSNKLGSEEKDRIEKIDELEDNLNKSVKQIDSKIADLGKALDAQSHELNQKMLKQSQDYNTEMNNQFEQAIKRMDDYKNDLSNVKVDKSLLAEMLNTLAMQINNDS